MGSSLHSLTSDDHPAYRWREGLWEAAGGSHMFQCTGPTTLPFSGSHETETTAGHTFYFWIWNSVVYMIIVMFIYWLQDLNSLCIYSPTLWENGTIITSQMLGGVMHVIVYGVACPPPLYMSCCICVQAPPYFFARKRGGIETGEKWLLFKNLFADLVGSSDPSVALFCSWGIHSNFPFCPAPLLVWWPRKGGIKTKRKKAERVKNVTRRRPRAFMIRRLLRASPFSVDDQLRNRAAAALVLRH